MGEGLRPMSSGIYLPTALQQAGVASQFTGVPVPIASGLVQSGTPNPVPTAIKSGLDVSVGLWYQRLGVSISAARPAHAGMFACEGNPAQYYTAPWFMNRTRCWRTRKWTSGPSSPQNFYTSTQTPGTLKPSVFFEPTAFPAGYDIFNDVGWHAPEFANWIGGTDYNVVMDVSKWTVQARQRLLD